MEKVKLRYIAGYGMAAIGYNFVYMLVTQYVNIYFTNVLGISFAAVGVIMLIARVWDGINDPIMGSIVDRTHTPHGKYRPYLLWGIIPLAISTVLVFVNFGLSGFSATFLAGAVYILFGMSYTFANIGYMSMQSTLSTDSNERTKIIVIKQVFTMIGILIVMMLVPKLGIAKDGSLIPQGFLTVSIVGAVIVALTMFISFKATAKFKYIEKDTEEITWKIRWNAVSKNKPLIIVIMVFFLVSLSQALMAAQNYYILDVLKRGDLALMFNMIMIVPMVISMAFTPIAMKFEKRTIMIFGSFLFAAASIAWFFFAKENINLMLILAVLRGLGLGFAMIFVFSMITDCVDYAKLQTGKHQGGIIFSTATFMQKTAGGIGGLLLNVIMIWIGFKAGQSAYSNGVADGVLAINTLVPALFSIICAVLLFYYPLSKAKMKEIGEEIGSQK